MALQFTNVPEHDLSGGIDVRSAENLVAPTFCEDVLNADIIEARLKKREGYQSYSGCLPLRVNSVKYTAADDTIQFILDSSIDLSSVKPTPIIVYGRETTATDGDFSSGDEVHYYSSFSADIRKTLNTGSNTLAIDNDDHNLETANLFVGIAESTSLTNNSNTHFEVDEIAIDKSTFDVDIDYTNNTGSTISSYVYYADKDAATGSVYVDSAVAIGVGNNTVTVTAGTHNLNNFNIIPKIYEDTGTELIEFEPDKVTIGTTGTVSVQVNNVTSAFTARLILSSVSAANSATGVVPANTTQNITITDITSPFVFISSYLEDLGTGELDLIIPNSVTYNDTTNQLQVQIVNPTASAKNFELFYEFGQVRSNKLTVTSSQTISADAEGTAPQLTLWGICHEDIYSATFSETSRSGWTTHIDSYRRSGERRLISGLGGNLFASRTRTEVGTTYLMPQYLADVRARVSTDSVLSPLFHGDAETPGRSRGYITGTGTSSNFVTVTDIAWVSGTSVKYTLSIPGLKFFNSSDTEITFGAFSGISTTAGFEDRLQITNAGRSVLNGTFKILSVTNPTSTTLELTVENTSVTSADYDEADVGGRAGVFTDIIAMDATTKYLPGDRILSAVFPGSVIVTTIASDSTSLLVSGFVDTIEVGAGLKLTAQRTSSVIPLRDVAELATVTNIVAGDTLSYTDIDRTLTIVSINENSDITVSITGDGATATLTLGSGSTDNISIGDNLLLVQAGDYSGVVTVTGITSSSILTFSSTETDSVTGAILVGKTIHIDENLEWSDTLDDDKLFTVDRRWIPIEAPDDSFDLTPSQYVTHFDDNLYVNQPFLRSVMVSDNMYFTNGCDEVLKFDGSNIYRAGLFRWQPNAFVAKHPAGSPSGGKITLTAGSETYNYYFRLNAIDVNNNIIASAVTGQTDYTTTLTVDSAIQLRLIGMPAWDIYDYDRLEVEIYRTKANTAAPYFKIVTIPMSFDNQDGYIDYYDTTSDAVLSEQDIDRVNTNLVGAELGTAWEQPMRAKYLTTAQNRLVLANLSDYPELDIQLTEKDTGDAITNASLDGKKLLFRRRNSQTGTTTDMSNTAAYEFIDSATVSHFTVSGISASLGKAFTVTTTAAHGFSIGDWVYLYWAAVGTDQNLQYAGWWQVAGLPTGTTFTINWKGSGSGPVASFPTRVITSSTGTDIPVLIGADGNREDNAVGIRVEAMNRMSEAINASMRVTDTALTGQSAFAPWMTANSDSNYAGGQLVVRQPKIDSALQVGEAFEVVLPTFSSDFRIFVNQINRADAAEISATTRLFPSRVLISYENFPEIFDNPTSVLPSDSDSVIDINPADGQEITGVIPFFGDSAFGGAQKSGIVVVFKSNSIYLIDIAQKVAGSNAVQRLETQGLGCTAPYSITVTKEGIMFANESGIYRLRRDLNIEYIGRRMERNWLESVDRDSLDIAQGTHYPIGRRYKLSVPIKPPVTTTDIRENSEVYVYHHTGELDGRPGGWTRYDNHPATGWANLDSDAYFASTNGKVFQLRRTGLKEDFRDDSSAVNMVVTTRALDFGAAGVRKVVSHIITHFRAITQSEGTSISYAPDLNETFDSTDQFVIVVDGSVTNFGDIPDEKIRTIKTSLGRRRVVYMQFRFTNGTIDEPLDIAGFDVRVAPLKSSGIRQAADTR